MTLNKQAQLIRYQDCPSTSWKNGGGSTKQLLISPINAELTEFDYRLSIASIGSNGPFSLFNGIDRQLVILEGNGVELSIDSHEGKKQINDLGADVLIFIYLTYIRSCSTHNIHKHYWLFSPHH